MSKNTKTIASIAVGAVMLAWTTPATAAPPKDPPTKCAPDAVLVGSGCMDAYEASVWRIPAFNLAGKSNKGLIKKVRKGKADTQDLLDGGATQLGTTTDDYAPCSNTGQNCVDDIYAVSLPGVLPASFIAWFQALEACTNSGKRLPTNAEWQAAANGTPDPGTDNGTTDCNTETVNAKSATGSRSNCESGRGAFDMVGNLREWVAEWVPRATACPNWGSFSDDLMCLSGASTTNLGAAPLLRGGSFSFADGLCFGGGANTLDGPLSVSACAAATSSFNSVGFRCAR